jgi:hypothetical protein
VADAKISAGGTFLLNLWEDSTDLGTIGRWEPGKASTQELGQIFARYQRTPAAGAKVYTIRCYMGQASTGTMYMGNAGTVPPATFTITRA